MIINAPADGYYWWRPTQARPRDVQVIEVTRLPGATTTAGSTTAVVWCMGIDGFIRWAEFARRDGGAVTLELIPAPTFSVDTNV